MGVARRSGIRPSNITFRSSRRTFGCFGISPSPWGGREERSPRTAPLCTTSMGATSHGDLGCQEWLCPVNGEARIIGEDRPTARQSRRRTEASDEYPRRLSDHEQLGKGGQASHSSRRSTNLGTSVLGHRRFTRQYLRDSFTEGPGQPGRYLLQRCPWSRRR